MTLPSVPEPLSLHAADGFAIQGFFWRHAGSSDGTRAVVIINAANSVRCRYYFRFAAFLFEHGFDVIAYDYRGIGESRPATLRGFDASWIHWGRLDFDAVLRHAGREFAGQPIHIVAHSIGGFLIGLAPSNHLIHRVFTMGAQYAYWPDYAAGAKLRMIAKWHVAMPLITSLFGYFPAKKLGWMEDTPKGVARDWAFSRARLDPHAAEQFAAVTAPTLAVSVTYDEFGTVSAVERLLAYFRHSPRTHLRISPQSIAEPQIGHFGFFHTRLQQKLWQMPLHWLKHGQVPESCPGVFITKGNHGTKPFTHDVVARSDTGRSRRAAAGSAGNMDASQ